MKDDFKPTTRTKAVAVAPKTKVVAVPKKQHIEVEQKMEEPAKVKVRLHKRIHWWLKSLSRKQQFLLLFLFFVIAGGAAYGTWKFRQNDFHEAGYVAPVAKVVPPPAPTTIASRMTGVQVAPELNNLPVTGVMIENSPDARPQSGLLQADMVYEAIAEGGITRFLALFQESKPDYIGPVRSVRPYYIDFLIPYQASIAHAGGSNEALTQIRNTGVRDLDYSANGSSYDRISNRAAPHNLYTSRDRLLTLQAKKGYTTSSYQGFVRKAKETPSATPNARSIDFTISSALYNPHYDYDVATNSYLRSEGGKPHIDERSGKQIAPKVVIAIVTPHSYEGIYSSYQTVGSGTATIFQDGVVLGATWNKASRNSEFILKDSAGTVIPLNPGQTWLSLVAATGAIKYTP